MPKRIAAIAALVLAIGLAGCTAVQEPSQEPVSAPESTETVKNVPAPTETAESLSAREPDTDITAAGEVCDPHNLNDSICAAFYPEQAIANMTSPERAREPLASMPLDEKVSLAHQACENMTDGARPGLVDTILRDDDDPAFSADRNNASVYSAAAVAFCTEHAAGTDEHPDKTARIIAFYQALGEQGAKEHFADKTMPTPTELGY